MGYFAGRRPHLLAIDAVAVKTIMIQNFANFSDNEVADMMSLASDPIIAGNPFFQHSQAWKNTRRELAPGLTQNRVKSYYPIIRRVCQQLHRTLNEKCSGSTSVDMDDVSEIQITVSTYNDQIHPYLLLRLLAGSQLMCVAM